MSKEIEIPFGAKDSELKGWEYTIPEGMEAVIKDGKIIVREQESEDEGIRKAITEIVEQSNIIGLHGISREKMFAWLENQKEAKDFGELMNKLTATEQQTMFDAWEYDKQKALKKQEEQKPIEWSDNFEENIRNLLHEKLKQTSDDGSMSSAVFIDDKTLKDIISGIWFYVGKEALKYPDKQLNVEQKPVSGSSEKANNHKEWGEEDIEIIDRICSNLEYLIQTVGHDSESKGKLEERIKWMKRLKSLRPQPHWKPIEKQMKFLDVAIAAILDNNKSSNLASGLITLRKDLEKLM